MASGVKVAEESVTAFENMKYKKKTRYIIMEIRDGLIKINCVKERDSSKEQEDEYKEFLEQLPVDVGRYCLLDLNIPQKNGSRKDKLFMITWCPEKASMKSNILYTTSKKALVDKVSEGLVDIQANDLSDLDYCEIMDRECK